MKAISRVVAEVENEVFLDYDGLNGLNGGNGGRELVHMSVVG